MALRLALLDRRLQELAVVVVGLLIKRHEPVAGLAAGALVEHQLVHRVPLAPSTQAAVAAALGAQEAPAAPAWSFFATQAYTPLH